MSLNIDFQIYLANIQTRKQILLIPANSFTYSGLYIKKFFFYVLKFINSFIILIKTKFILKYKNMIIEKLFNKRTNKWPFFIILRLKFFL